MRLAVAEVEAVAAGQAAVGEDHPLGPALGNLDVGGDRERLVQHRRRGAVGQRDLAGIVDELVALAGEARPALEFGVQPFDGAPVERQHVVLLRLLPEQGLEFLDLLRVLGRQVVGLGEVLVDVVELPLRGQRVERAADRHPRDEAAARRHPAVVVDARG